MILPICAAVAAFCIAEMTNIPDSTWIGVFACAGVYIAQTYVESKRGVVKNEA